MSVKLTKDIFIQRAKNIHKDENDNTLYIYNNVNYINSHTKVCIICPKHGEFWQVPYQHLNGCGCPKCKSEKLRVLNSSNTDVFISKVKEKYGDTYILDKVNYVNNRMKIVVTCRKHGDFLIKPNDLLNGHGCPFCKNKILGDIHIYGYVNLASKKHNNFYSYEKCDFIDNKHDIIITCPIHGDFSQNPIVHLKGHGCPECKKEKIKEYRTLPFEYFQNKAKKIHNNKYVYYKNDYVNLETKTKISCLEHGEFWQTPKAHLTGQGCPKCSCSLIENKVRLFLIKCGISFEMEYNDDDLGRQFVDFYLLDFDLYIECQGKQHFVHIPVFKNDVAHVKKLDERKYNIIVNNKKKELIYIIPTESLDVIETNEIYHHDNIITFEEFKKIIIGLKKL